MHDFVALEDRGVVTAFVASTEFVDAAAAQRVPGSLTVRVAFGTDEVTAVTDAVKAHLAEQGHEVVVVADPESWPEVGRGVGEAVASGAADRGVVCCWTGTGVAMAATKVPGVRAALCTDAETARGARRWNDANVLALGLRLTSEPLLAEILDAWFAASPSTDPEDRENVQRVGRLDAAGRTASVTAADGDR